MSPGSSLEPYVRQEDEISTAETAHLVDKKYKQPTNTLHAISTPKEIKVRQFHPILPLSQCYEENFPNAQALDAASAVRFGLCCTSESSYFS